MKNVMTAGAALLLTTSLAQAGGLDRSGQPVGIIFEEGNVVQLSFGYVNPTVSGAMIDLAGGFESGNIAEAYTQLGAGIKYSVSDKIDVALILDQPYGAKVSYSDAETGYYTNNALGDLSADASSTSITALARYKINESFSVHGGLRYQTVEVSVDTPPVTHTIVGDPSSSTGFVVGGAYEIPAIALRVALTYNSKISHEMDIAESLGGTALPVTTTTFDTPESLNLDFQTGIAEDTLLFGSVRYAKWTQFDFRPIAFATATGLGDPALGASLQSYDEDTFAYSLGVGRRLSDELSAAISVGYEGAQGGFAGPLAPTDGNLSVGVGGTYTMGDTEFTAGVRYIMIGDADLAAPGTDTQVASFTDNSAIAIGFQISQSF